MHARHRCRRRFFVLLFISFSFPSLLFPLALLLFITGGGTGASGDGTGSTQSSSMSSLLSFSRPASKSTNTSSSSRLASSPQRHPAPSVPRSDRSASWWAAA
ncbi:hypothetical protein C8J57DRAFT_1353952 [Mycena rebaudengoi]|nr:hypothetical protein C8J57DRAFT_1353952 [Mycena rebaudengoi]